MDYVGQLAKAPATDYEVRARWLHETLPMLWLEEYRASANRVINVMKVEAGGFCFGFDLVAELIALGELAVEPEPDDRTVFAWGRSRVPPAGRKHEDARLRGWPVAPEHRAEDRWDRGHFIGHSFGGVIDRAELNVFRQLRVVNRGWSPAGKRYRSMEKCAAATPGSFVFSRPVYEDHTAYPAKLEFGVLTADGLWVEEFSNV